VEALSRVADTLGMMGLGVARNVVLQQRDAMHEIVAGNRSADEGALLDIAGALLYVDASLDDQVARLGRADSEDSDTIGSESRKVLDILIREAIANFADARQAFVAFVETSWDHSQLDDVPRLLDEVGGALRILEVPQPAEYLVGVARYTQNELLARKRVPNGQQLDTLADALASIEYYLEAMRDNRPNREGILDIARQSLETLHYWPLPAVEAAKAAESEAAFDIGASAEAESTQVVSTPTQPVAVEPVAFVSEPTPPVAAAPPAPVATGAAGGFEATSDDIDDEIREVFLEEFEEEIGHLESMLPAWRAAPEDNDRLRPIRRVFHTLKGSGRLVGAKTLGEFSWKIENMLNRVLDGTRPPSEAVIALVDQAYYTLPHLHAALRGEAPLTADLAGIEAIADRVAAGEEATYVAAAAPVVEVAAPIAEATVETIVEVVEAPAVIAEAVVADEEPTIAAKVDPVLLEILGTEVGGHLVTIDAWLAQAQSHPIAANDALLRAMHTMNGAFAMTEVPAITNLTGPAETYIKRMLAAHALPTVQGVAALAATAEAIRRTVDALQSDTPRVPVFETLARQVAELRDSLPEAKMPLLPTEPVELEAAELTGGMDLSEFTDLAAQAPVDTGLQLQDETAQAEVATTDEMVVSEDLSAFLDLAREIPVDAGIVGGEAEDDIEEIVLEDIVLDGEIQTPTHDEMRADLAFDEASIESITMEASDLSLESPAMESGEAFDAAAVDAQAALEASLLDAERRNRSAWKRNSACTRWKPPSAWKPNASPSNAKKPSASKPSASKPNASKPNASKPNASKPNASKPNASKPNASKPNASKPNASNDLEAERLEAERIEAERLEAERIEAERVQAERVEAERLAAEEEAEYARIEAEEAALRQAREQAEAQAAQPIAPIEEPAVEPEAETEAEPAVAQMLADAMAGHGDPDEPLDLSDLDPELVDIFCEEGGDLLDHSDGLLAQLREAPTEREHLVGLQRDLHTLKGGARMAGIMAVGELGHAMESLLEAVVEHRSELGRDGIPLLERGFDRLHAMVTRVAERRAIAMPDALIAQFDARAKGRTYEPEAEPAYERPVHTPKVELKPLSAPVDSQPVGDDDDAACAPRRNRCASAPTCWTAW
jgi:chemosensory pili system protein ChpA (sensor histidine kinase/response regulator)